jgi:hypothetical protein
VAFGCAFGGLVSAGALNEFPAGEGALTGRCFFAEGSTAWALTDASSVGPLNEGFDLVGRLKYFLRLAGWSLLGIAAGSGWFP